MMNRIWLSPPHLSGKEIEFVQDAFNKNWITTMGDNVTGLEADVRSFLEGNEQAVVVNSGTAALHLSLILLGVGKGDQVICQDLTFAATVNPVIYQGAEPVLVDSERKTWNLSPVFLEEAIVDCIRQGKKPKAIIWVDLYGMPAQIHEIREIARKYEIALIEDAAEAFGSAYYGRKCGAWGDISVISFNGNKIITTSGGGVLLSKNREQVEKARFLAAQARDPAPWYQHSQTGYNYGMSNITAGIGRGQMTVLNERVEARRANNRFYKAALAGIPGIEFQTEPNEHYFSNYWLSCLLVHPEKTGGIDCGAIRQKLTEKNIESRFLWKPMHLQPVFKDCTFYGDGTSEDLFRTGLCLPSGSALTKEELTEITDSIKDTLK